VAIVVAGALLAPLLTPYDPVTISPESRLLQPSSAHPLGTDIYGRDTLTRVLYGGRISLAVGALSVGLALPRPAAHVDGPLGTSRLT
jgi:peptide/nickel transport system permease protein